MGYYMESSGNFLPMFWTTYGSYPQSLRIQKKACNTKMEYI